MMVLYGGGGERLSLGKCGDVEISAVLTNSWGVRCRSEPKEDCAVLRGGKSEVG